MTPLRQLHHRRRQLEAARNIGVKYEHVGLVFDADNALHKVAWFVEQISVAPGANIAGLIGKNGWGPQWGSVIESAKFTRRYESLKGMGI